MGNNILIIDTSNINKGVFKSHVFSLSQNLKGKKGILSINHGIEEKKLDHNFFNTVNTTLEYGWKIFSHTQLFNPFFYYRILQVIKKENITVLYCQNYLPSFLGVILKCFNRKIKVHADIKGIVPEEHLLYNSGVKKHITYLVSKVFEIFIFNFADSYSVVSDKFKKYFIRKYNLSQKEIIVLPSSLNDDVFYFDKNIREQKRKILGWENKNILIYSGSMVEWQMPEKLLYIMNKITEKEASIIPIVLTLEIEKAKKIKEKKGLSKLHIYSAKSPQEVNEYLNASDVAVTLRKNDIVNNVSSPTKIAEYLYTRNKVILSKGIGDYSELSEKYTGIYKISDINDINISKLVDFIKTGEKLDMGIKKLIKNEYTMQANIKKINTLLNGYKK